VKRKLLLILALAVIVLSLLPASFTGSVIAAPSSHANVYKVGDEVTEGRSEFSKTYYQGGGQYTLVIGGDVRHWRENWYDESEPWKEVDLTWEHLPGGVRQITKAPYILVQNGNLVTFTDRRTGEISAIELLSIKPNIPFEIVPFVDGFSFQYRVPNLNVPFEAQFRVIGNPILSSRAYDDIGEFELETTFVNGILTEKLSAPTDKITGKARAIKGDIRIDPTTTVQPATKDTLLNGASDVGKVTNYGASTLIAVARDDEDPLTYYRSILHFTLPANPGGIISSVKLYLYKYFDLAGYTCIEAEAHELTQTAWVEMEATWYSHTAAANWTSGGGDYSATIIDTTNDLQPFGIYGWEYWNLLGAGAANPIAIDWTDDVHLLMKYPEPIGEQLSYEHWYSSDYAVDPALRPKLVIEYAAAAAGTNNPTLRTATKATLNGMGPDAVTTDVGFVWDTVSRGDPGNLAPGATAYSDSWTDAGNYQNLPFEHRITGLDYLTNAIYYFRAAAKSGGVWGYGEELNMTAFEDIWNSGAIVTQVPAGPAATGRNCIVADDYLYAVEQSYRNLVIYDVSDPESPVLQSLTSLPNAGGCDLEKKGDYLIITMVGYADTQPIGITVWNVINPASPVLVKTLTICNGGVHGLYLNGNVLYTAGWDTNAIYSIDVTYPASATLLDSVTSGTYLPGAHDIYIKGNYAYTANWNAGATSYGFGVVNIANPSNMYVVTGAALNWKGSHITGTGDNYVYAGSHQPSLGLKAFDISDPSNPVETDHIGNVLAYASLGYWNDWYSDYLVSISAQGGDGGTHVTDVSNPAAMAFIAHRWDTGTYARSNVFVENGYLFLPYNVQTGGFWEWHIENVELILLKARTLTSAATSVGATTARLNAVIDDAGEATCDVQFRYKRVGDAIWIETAWQSGKVTDGTAYADLTGLVSGTEYHFQVRPRNSVGEWQWSDSRTFTTSTLGVPIIATEDASRVAFSTARLNSVLTDDGGQPCTIRFGWGNTTEAAIEDYEYYETLPGVYYIDSHPCLDVVGLNASMVYYFRVEAENDSGTDLGDELNFTTISFTGTPQNFNGIPSDDSISLWWDPLPGASNYLIMYKAGDYPTGTTDGMEVYFDTSASTVHEDLTPGTTYYYMLWGESGGTYSSNATLMLTTTAGAGAGMTPDYTSPTEIPRWLGGTDYTNVDGLGFIYTITNNVADALDVPRGNWWFASWMILSVVAGIVVYVVSKGKLMIATMIMTTLLVVGWLMMLVPFWIPIVGGIIIIAAYVGHRDVARGGS